MGLFGKRRHGIEIVSESHDLELGVGTRFVSVLADAGTTLVTRGLAATGRPELALVLFRAPAAFPDAQSERAALAEMTEFLRVLASRAEQSPPMRAGTVLTFERGLVRPHLQGMVLVKPPLLGRAACVPAGALVGVPLFLDEAELAEQSSPYRVLTRLGMEIQEFPFPPWLDALRSSVALGEPEQSSWLCRMPSARTEVAFLAEHTDPNPNPAHLARLSLEIRAGARDAIMRTFSTRPATIEPIAFVGVPNDEAKAWLAWRPGQQGFCAVIAPGVTPVELTGTFFGFAPDLKFDIDRALMAEDGYMLFPTAASWRRIQTALATGAPLTLPLQHGRFELTWQR